MEKLIDFAFSRPSPAAIKAAGYAGVIRYLCIDQSKRISPAEADGYHSVGLTVTLTYEDGAADAEGGQAAGAAKAAVAKPQLAALGVPGDRPVYFAVDENLAAGKYDAALACIQTFASNLGRPQAVYGPRPFLVFCKENHVSYLWETSAADWNTGPEPQGLQLQQEVNQVVVDGTTVDEDLALVGDYGQWPYNVPVPPPPPSPTPTVSGYWVASSAGSVYPYGKAASYSNLAVDVAVRPVVAMAATLDGNGYWLVTSEGNVFNYGDAPFFGSPVHENLKSPISAFAVTPDNKGYWVVSQTGAVFPYGDAQSYSNLTVNLYERQVVAMAPSVDGKGYYLVTNLGNVYNFGDAPFLGSKAHDRLPYPVVSIAVTPDDKGYYLATSGGNIYNYGDATFFGSKANIRLAHAVVQILPTLDGTGYYLVTSGGNVYNFGDAPFFGSPVHVPLPGPISAMAIRP